MMDLETMMMIFTRAKCSRLYMLLGPWGPESGGGHNRDQERFTLNYVGTAYWVLFSRSHQHVQTRNLCPCGKRSIPHHTFPILFHQQQQSC